MAVKPGYKQTDVGILPLDWGVASVDSEFSIQLGKMLDAEKNLGLPRPLIGNRAVQWGRIDLDGVGEIKIAPSELNRYRLRVGDLLVCEGGEVGRAAIWDGELEECYYQKALHRLRPKGSYDVKLMQNMLRRMSDSGYLRNFVTQTSIAHLPKDKLAAVQLPYPPTAEQAVIAEALSDADVLIESLEQLLAKKRQIKLGAMQELLTSKSRLPGFSEVWAKRRLGSLADIRSGGTPSTSNSRLWGGDILWCTPTDITALGDRKYLGGTARTISKEGLDSSSAEIIPARSVIMTSRATIGECAINIVQLTTNQGFKNFVPFASIDVEFLYYLLLMQKQAFIGLCGGSTFLEIGKAQLAGFEVTLPKDKIEQIAIATVLSDMDAELVVLETRLTKARQLKQGMMQELLTGRIRLV